jgi:RNA polymerase sigma factor (sigma-70 family)
MRNDQTVIRLVTAAQNGNQQAWGALVERYSPMVWSICRRYQLGRADAEDVVQDVWLRLVGRRASLRDPAAVAGWLATTTRRECVRVVRTARRPAVTLMPDVGNIADSQTGIAEQELLIAERHAALREAVTHLPVGCQRLITLLIEDPPAPYAEISATLGIPVGSIGPSRLRCLGKLRQHPAIAALISADAAGGGSELAA